MGLDAVELILRVEDQFKISIADDEAAHVRTVGDLFQVVLSKLDTTPACLSSKAFYRTRQALVECLHVPRRSIRPSTWLDSILPESSRPQIWQELSSKLGLTLPPLRNPRNWKNKFQIIGIIVAGVLLLATNYLANSLGWLTRTRTEFDISFVLGLLITAFLVRRILLNLTPSLRTELPVNSAGDLARLLLSTHYEYFAPTAEQGTIPSKEYIWTCLVEIITDQLQIEPEDVVPNARFIEDLGVD